MSGWRLAGRVVAAAFVVVVAGAVTSWAVNVTREIRIIRAEIPDDRSLELEELDRKVDALIERLDRVETAVADAESTATEANEAVDELRDDVIALGLSLSR